MRTAVLVLALITVGCTAEPFHPLPAGTTLAVRGHRELAADHTTPLFLVAAGGTPVPGAAAPGLCLDVPVGNDTSQWEGSLTLEGTSAAAAAPAPPVARSGTVLCFEAAWPPRLPVMGAGRLCGEVVDRWNGDRYRIPCRPIRFAARAESRAALISAVGRAVADRHGAPRASFAAGMDDLAERAAAAELPWLAAQIRLIAVHYLIDEGEMPDLHSARRRLEALPDWIGGEATHGLAADAAYLEGRLDLAADLDLEGAWGHFRDAERHYRRIIGSKRLAATRGLAEILARVGAIREAKQRLADGLADCAAEATPSLPRGPCSPSQRKAARGLVAWLALLDPDAGNGELHASDLSLAELVDDPALEAQERANYLVNRALLQARQGELPDAALAAARELLAPDRDSSRKALLLLAWSGLVEATYQLSMPRGDLPRALRACEEVAAAELTPRLTAWAHSCSGRVRHRQGDLDGAALAFDLALAYHEHATPERLGQLLPVGPGQRADDFYRAARIAVERGEGRRCWDLLADLDRLAAREETCRRCRELGIEAPDRRVERHALLRRLSALGGPSPGGETRETLRRVLERLRELAPPCGACAAPPPADTVPGYRAFSLDDEIFLLQRDQAGNVTLARRTRFQPGEVKVLVDAVQAALDRRTTPDEEWRALTAPLGRALIPPQATSPTASLEPLIVYRLHGLLQSVPLEALTVPGDGPPRWLGDLTTVVVRPAGLRPPEARPEPLAAPVFVVDPMRNLHGREALVAAYRRLFPDSRLLAGKAASLAAFRHAFARARWLHADAHGAYDSAFPEHSSLELADGSISLVELADLPMNLEFVNLSGCRTGTWPTTADSGRYGIGGLIARRGARWVIASRSDLLDRLAMDLNPVFYEKIRDGQPVPAAYRLAMDQVRQRHPAATWGAIFLIGDGATPNRGG